MALQSRVVASTMALGERSIVKLSTVTDHFFFYLLASYLPILLIVCYQGVHSRQHVSPTPMRRSVRSSAAIV